LTDLEAFLASKLTAIIVIADGERNSLLGNFCFAKIDGRESFFLLSRNDNDNDDNSVFLWLT